MTAHRKRTRPRESFRDVVAVIMAGGFGTRFWPLGTAERPKQFLTALTGRSLYAQAALRARRLVPWRRILVMTNAAHVGLVREQTPNLPHQNIIAEPMRRDTAAAVILAAVIARRRFPGAVSVVTPADHLIQDADAFRRTVAAAVKRARDGGLGTIGIRPTYPATGFGYLRLARRPKGTQPACVEQFKEKPTRREAETYLASGRYLWNAGMFIWRAETFLETARRHLPQTCALLEPLGEALGTKAFARRARAAFRRLRPISVDFGLMEKAEDVWSVPAQFDWSDVGGWEAAAGLLPADRHGNRVRGSVLLDRASGNVIIADADHPVLVVGVRNSCIVQGPGGLLVCDRRHTERLKPLIERILA
ncbi:MAG: sugar phosphate nucleotidyltransferase [Phycisphaerae bacterium]|nr:sugar phosphate nucleotidyltransferase [Phycisphaerae bacterium]